MTEFKEKLINEIKEEIMSCMDDCHLLGIIDREADIEELELILMHVLREKLNSDCIIIDRNKFKSKIMVIDYGPYDTLGNHNACLVSRFYFDQYVTPETLVNVDMDILKDRFKDNLIETLEECDF